jgi:hypothetical protein
VQRAAASRGATPSATVLSWQPAPLRAKVQEEASKG